MRGAKSSSSESVSQDTSEQRSLPRLTSTGSPAVVLDSSNALHGDLGVIADGDVVLALSASGETEEMVRILPAIARFQVRIIAMCGDP